jgi:hypothetical protein
MQEAQLVRKGPTLNFGPHHSFEFISAVLLSACVHKQQIEAKSNKKSKFLHFKSFFVSLFIVITFEELKQKQ